MKSKVANRSKTSRMIDIEAMTTVMEKVTAQSQPVSKKKTDTEANAAISLNYDETSNDNDGPSLVYKPETT